MVVPNLPPQCSVVSPTKLTLIVFVYVSAIVATTVHDDGQPGIEVIVKLYHHTKAHENVKLKFSVIGNCFNLFYLLVKIASPTVNAPGHHRFQTFSRKAIITLDLAVNQIREKSDRWLAVFACHSQQATTYLIIVLFRRGLILMTSFNVN